MAAPLDRRLLRAAPSARRYLAGSAALQALDTALIVARGVLIGSAAAALITSHGAEKRWALIAVLLGIVAAQAATQLCWQQLASYSIGQVLDELRVAAFRALSQHDPREVEAEAGTWRVTLSDGLEGVRPYLRDYVPALLSAAVSTPAACAVMWYFDPLSGQLALATLPLIPVFMVLIGTLTRDRTQSRLRVASALSAQLDDILRGSATLRALGATEQPREQIASTGRRHASVTMSVLRLAFLSSFALEFIATLSVALVAVSIGLRLVVGDIPLRGALIALIIAPEVYAPLRRVGSSFHAAADGMTAARAVFDLLDRTHQWAPRYLFSGAPGGPGFPGTPGGPGSPGTPGAPGSPGGPAAPDNEPLWRLTDVSVRGRDGVLPAHLSFTARPGTVTWLRGANGAGKSTALLAMLGQIPSQHVTGTIERPDTHISFLPARAILRPGDVQSNLSLLGDAHFPLTEVGFDLPLSHPVGREGAGISAGQAQRLALARALRAPAEEAHSGFRQGPATDDEPQRLRTFLLDEPTAHLNDELVSLVLTAIKRRAAAGGCVIIASHDPRVAAISDQVIDLA